MALIMFIVLCFSMAIISREVAYAIELNIDLNLQLDIPTMSSLLTNVVGNCLKYPTQEVPQDMVEKTWYQVTSITSNICTSFCVKETIQNANGVLELVYVTYMNQTGYITTGQFIRQEIRPGLYFQKEYTANNQASLNGTLPTYVTAILQINSDSLLLDVCAIKPTTTHEVLTIFTTTGADTSSVIPFEMYTRNQNISTDTFQHLNLSQCASIYSISKCR